MSVPPVPAASFPIPPPVRGVTMGTIVNGRVGEDGVTVTGQIELNNVGFEYHTKQWAAIQGAGGLKSTGTASQDQINALYANEGDVNVAASGLMTVVSSEGRVFVQSAFTDTTDASNITSGAMAQAQVKGLNGAVTVSALPTPTAGLRYFVSDSTVAAAGNFGAVVAGGGTDGVPVYGDGSAWRIG